MIFHNVYEFGDDKIGQKPQEEKSKTGGSVVLRGPRTKKIFSDDSTFNLVGV